jgi:UTP--glucose-1-phosphate uridylyltransferase
MAVRRAVIAAAGLGTRFLPQTKAMPKEMLPIIDKPVIQYIVEELIEAGIRDIIIVTGYHKRSIEDHFDAPGRDLVMALTGDESKAPMLKALEDIANLANFVYIRQKGPTGNGTPLLNAAHLLDGGPFIYTFGDDFIKASPGRFSQLVEVNERTGHGVLSCIRASEDEDYARYGFVRGHETDGGLFRVDEIIEKPGKARAPSTLASVSSYLFTPKLLDYLQAEHDELVAGQELSLQAAIQRYVDAGHVLLAHEVQNARYYDSGNKLEYLKTIIDFGLADQAISADLRAYIEQAIGGEH